MGEPLVYWALAVIAYALLALPVSELIDDNCRIQNPEKANRLWRAWLCGWEKKK